MAVTPAEIAVELGRPTPEQDSAVWIQWSSWIDQARFLIKDRLGDLDQLDQESLDYVVLHAVAEHARNPQNVTQVEVRVDDGASTRRYSSGKGRVAILDEWWSMLSPLLNAPAGAYSVPLGAPWGRP